MTEQNGQAGSAIAELRFRPPFLTKYGLPDILYPVRAPVLDGFVGSGGEPPFAEMLYGLQLRSSEGTGDWQELEPALDRLAELIAPDDPRPVIGAAGDTWWLEIGPVDLDGPIVTIQRGTQLIAAISSRKDGRLRVETYRPLDAKSADYLTCLGLLPHPEWGVSMRENNWQYALDCSAGAGNFYGAERGEAHLSWWEKGIGIDRDGTVQPSWRGMRNLSPRRPSMAAIEIGIRYSLKDEE